MIKLKKEEIKDFFESRKKLIEKPVYSGFGEIVSGVSLWISLWTSEFEQNPYLPTTYLDSITFLIGLSLLIYGIYIFIDGKRSRQTTRNLYDSLVQLDCDTCHIVDIVLFHNKSNGKYLLIKNDAWKCALFPSYNAQLPFDIEREKQKVTEYFIRDTGLHPTKVTYINQMQPHIKTCYGTNTPFRYNFHFFHVEIVGQPGQIRKHAGNKYVWKSLDSMRKNKNIMKKNSDVIEYIANLERVPYN